MNSTFYHNRALGQNFLCDEAIISKIIATSEVAHGDIVIEMGTGLGALTKPLALTGATIHGFEIDVRLQPYLVPLCEAHPNLKLHYMDIRKVDLAEYNDNQAAVRVCANLPYVFTQTIIEQIMLQLPNAKSVTLMLQKEAASRLTVACGTKEYSKTAVMMALLWQKQREFTVPKTAFSPAPEIESCVIHWHGCQTELTTIEAEKLWKFLSICFSQRRKQLQNLLKNSKYASVQKFLGAYGYPDTVRAEQISPENWFNLFRRFEAQELN